MKRSERPASVKMLLPYFGSKSGLGPTIVGELGRHRAYWEPFCGSMAVLLSKPRVSTETVNDMYGDLVNLARVVVHPRWGPALYRRLRRTLTCESLFHEAKAAIHKQRDWAERDIDKACCDRAYTYFVFSWLGRKGLTGTASLSVFTYAPCYTANAGPVVFQSAVASIPMWRRRLRRVTILRRDGFKLLERIDDAPGVAIYVDPPYVKKTATYVHDFEQADHARLAELLCRFRHARVVVSYYPSPLLDELYPGWTRRHMKLNKAMTTGGNRGKKPAKATELLIINGPSHAKHIGFFVNKAT